MQVRAGSSAEGRTVAEAGLRGLGGVFLTSVRRRGAVTHAVSPDFVLAVGDVLFFAGDLSKVSAVAQRLRLRAVTDAFEEDLPALMGRCAGRGKASCASDAGSLTDQVRARAMRTLLWCMHEERSQQKKACTV